jgi:hypothetical protein
VTNIHFHDSTPSQKLSVNMIRQEDEKALVNIFADPPGVYFLASVSAQVKEANHRAIFVGVTV